jgi:4'-phosphopantetheinyl transferase
MSRREEPPARITVSPAQMGRGEATVALAHLDLPEKEVEPLAALLTADESARVERYHFPADRRRFIVGRAILRLLLGSCLQIAPSDLRFHYGPAGKPSLDPRQNWGNLHFNVARSGDLALYGLLREQELGIDLEYRTSSVNCVEIARRFFSPTENQVICSLSPAEQDSAFYSFWTRKEAYVKGIGSGLGLPLDQFTVPLATAAPVLVCGKSGGEERQGATGWVTTSWLVHDVQVPPGYFAALAVDGAITELRQWDVTCCGRKFALVKPG